MKKFAVIQVIASFSEDEIKEFDKVVRSPFFGGSNYIIKFWNEIKKAYPGFNEDKIARERIYKKLYPGKKYDDSVIRKLSSNLYKMAERYLGIKRAASEEYKVIDFYAALELRERKLNSLYEGKFKELNKYYESSSIYDVRKLIDRHLLQIQQMNYVTDKNESRRNFEERMLYYEYIIVYTLISLMQETTRIWVDKTVYGNEKRNNAATELLSFINIDDYLASANLRAGEYRPLIMLNRLMMKMFTYDTEERHYAEFRDFLFSESERMPKKAARMYFIFLLNYCLNKVRYTEGKYSREMSLIADVMHRLDIIVDPATKGIVPAFFSVISDSYTNSKRFSEAAEFIKTYSRYVQEEFRKDCINQAKANMLFTEGRYEEALYVLNESEPVVDYDKINNRLIKLMIFFELDRWEEFYLLIDSTRQFIRGNTGLAERFEKDSLKFLSIFKRLHEVKENRDVDIERLRLEITNAENLINKNWLFNKLAGLEKR